MVTFGPKTYIAFQCLFVTLLMVQSLMLMMGFFYGLSEVDAHKSAALWRVWNTTRMKNRDRATSTEMRELYELDAAPLRDRYSVYRRSVISGVLIGLLLIFVVLYAAMVEWWPAILGYSLILICLMGGVKSVSESITGIGYLIGSLTSVSLTQVVIGMCFVFSIKSHRDEEAIEEESRRRRLNRGF